MLSMDDESNNSVEDMDMDVQTNKICTLAVLSGYCKDIHSF